MDGNRTHDGRVRLTPRKWNNRSRVSNGRDILPGVDNRTEVARRYHDVVTSVVADLGGEDRLSQTKMHLVRRFAATVAMVEQIESRFVLGQEIDYPTHATMTSTLARLANSIGLSRKMRAVPSLSEHFNSKRRIPRTIEHDADDPDDEE